MAARKPFRLPPLFRAASAIADPVRHALVPIEAERYQRSTMKLTGLDDFDDRDGFGDRLAETVASLQEVDFNFAGRMAAKTGLEWHLINRLNLVEFRKQHPEAEQIEVKAPIIVVGLFRTGTTFLHNILAADPASRAGRMWEHSFPVGRRNDPLGDEKWRRWRTHVPLRLSAAIVPDQDEVHAVTPDAYEEDFFHLGTDMVIMTSILGFGDWPYAWRWCGRDMASPFRWHKRSLQALTMQRSADRWLLKCPWHLWNLKSLMAEYPDARIVHIHRDVVSTIGSECSLNARIACRMHRKSDVAGIGKFWMDYSERGLELGQSVKDQLPANQVHDVRLSDVRRDPAGEIAKIYDRFGLPYDDALLQKFADTAAEEPTLQTGKHRYAVEEYELRPAQIEERFSSYRDRFGV